MNIIGYYWIGATDASSEGIWRWASDGTVAGNYSLMVGGLLWANGNPNNADGEYCTAMDWGAVADLNCASSFSPLCQQPGT